MRKNNEHQLEALKAVKEWSSVLLSVQAALLGLLTIFGDLDSAARSDWRFIVLVTALTASSLISANVVGAIPSMIQELADHPIDDIYAMRNRWGINLSLLAFGQHFFLLVGTVALALLLLFGSPPLKAKPRPNKPPEPTTTAVTSPAAQEPRQP